MGEDTEDREKIGLTNRKTIQNVSEHGNDVAVGIC
jgi:hypothetical protein